MKTFGLLLVVSVASLTAGSVVAQTWTQTSAPSNTWNSIACSAGGNRLVAAAYHGGIWVSTDSGSTWIQTSAPQSGWLKVVSSADGTRLAAIGEPEPIGRLPPFSYTGSFYASADSGATWISNNVLSVPKGAKSSMVSSADGRELVVLFSFGSFGSALFTSTNSGAAWRTNNLPNGNWLALASSADGTRLVAAGFGVAVSTNSGSSWTSTNSLPVVAACVTLSADGSELITIIGHQVFVSTNLGMTWTQTSAPATNWIALVSSADATRLTALGGGNNGSFNPIPGPIYTSTDTGATWSLNDAPVQYWTCAAESADGSKLVAAAKGDAGLGPPGSTSGGGIWTSQTTPSPLLNITPSNTDLKLSWIAPSTNFVLRQSPDLFDWTVVTNPPVLNLSNLQNEVILSPASDKGFYRLKTP